jgi:hypothetical protein
MERVLVICEVGRLATALYLIVNKRDSNRSVNKSNHPIQNPLLLVTEPRTRDNILLSKWFTLLYVCMQC